MITFNNIVERFEIFAENHFFIKTFSFGSPDDVDLSKFTSFPLMHLVYTGATYDAGTKTYNLEVYILDAPADKDAKTIRQKEVVSDAEQCAEDIIADIKNGGNIFLFAQDYEVVNATTTPLEEETKNVLSGVLLDLSVSIPYEWDACNAPIDGVTPEGGDEISYARRGILRMITQNGATDVLSVRTIKVSNGTLTDEGDGVVSLDTAGAESLNELTDVTITSLTPSQFLQYNGISGFWENETLYLATLADTKGTPTEGQLLKRTGGFWQPADIGLNDLDGVTITSPISGNVLKYDSNLGWYNTNLPTPSPPPSTTDQLPEGTTNLYYTEARVSANADVAANTAKVGITAQQAADILNNNAKVGYTDAAVDARIAAANIGDLNDVPASLGTTGQILAVNSAGTELEYIDPSDGFISLDYARIRMGSDVLEGGASAQDFKSQTAQKAKFNTQEDLQGNGITIDTTNNRFSVTVAGHYRLTVNGSFDSTADRSNPTFYFRVNNTTDLLGEGMGYVRSTNDAEGTANVTRVIELAANDYVEVFGKNSANTSGVPLFATQAIFEIERVGAGAAGPTGATGQGVPTGGTANEALVKIDGTDYNTEWSAIYTQRYTTEAETLRAGGAETIELYYSAQADGDGLAEIASSDTPSAGYDIRRKLYYSEAGFADPDTGTWTQFTAIADNTTFNNAKAALLAYLKERTGGTVPISLKMTWEEVAQAPSFTGLLNESYGSGAEAAYSTRRLNGNVTDCMVIRRASDSTTQTIGFDGSGNIDESAIETFCTGTTCTVVTWKDQSGNGNDATQSDPTKQPTIYTGGQLVKEGGRLAVDFDGSNDYLEFTQIDLTGDCLIAHIATHNAADSAYGGPSGNFGAFETTTTVLRWRFSGATYNAIVPTITAGDQYLSLFRRESGTANMSYDGVDTTSQSLSGTGSFSILGAIASNTGYLLGKAQEYIFYASAKTSQNRTSIESNIGDYFTQNTPLLDTYSGAAAAYSLRLLDSSYVGSAVEVYNGSSYADIGFNVFGELDTVALAAHCGSNNGFVSKWYDQSGNSNDATQTTTANMPKIYDGTTGVVTENGKPAVEFNGSNDTLSTTYQPQLGTASTADLFTFAVSTQASSHRGTIWRASDSDRVVFNRWDSSNFQSTYRDSDRVIVSGVSSALSLNNQYLLTGSLTNGAVTNYVDGTINGTGSVSFTGDFNLTSPFYIGSRGGTGERLNGNLQELIFYPSDQSSNRSNIEDNINTFYSIY